MNLGISAAEDCGHAARMELCGARDEQTHRHLILRQAVQAGFRPRCSMPLEPFGYETERHLSLAVISWQGCCCACGPGAGLRDILRYVHRPAGKRISRLVLPLPSRGHRYRDRVYAWQPENMRMARDVCMPHVREYGTRPQWHLLQGIDRRGQYQTAMLGVIASAVALLGWP